MEADEKKGIEEEKEADGRKREIIANHSLSHKVPAVGLFLFSCSAVSYSLRPHGLQHAVFPVLHCLSELAQTHVH